MFAMKCRDAIHRVHQRRPGIFERRWHCDRRLIGVPTLNGEANDREGPFMGEIYRAVAMGVMNPGQALGVAFNERDKSRGCEKYWA